LCSPSTFKAKIAKISASSFNTLNENIYKQEVGLCQQRKR
jgi:hypothetical protein